MVADHLGFCPECDGIYEFGKDESGKPVKLLRKGKAYIDLAAYSASMQQKNTSKDDMISKLDAVSADMFPVTYEEKLAATPFDEQKENFEKFRDCNQKILKQRMRIFYHRL